MKMLQLSKKTRFAVIYPLIALFFVIAHTSEESMLQGYLVVLAGMAIRIWANGYVGDKKVNRTQKDKGQAPIGKLVTAGPYAFVRHPLYLGTLLIAFGLSITAANIWLGIVIFAVLAAVYQKKMNEEDALLAGECAEFEDYRSAVHRLLPSLKPYGRRQGKWTWKGFAASKEWKTDLWLGVLFFVIYFREEWYQEHELFEWHEWHKYAAFIAVMCFLVLIDAALQFSRRQRPVQAG